MFTEIGIIPQKKSKLFIKSVVVCPYLSSSPRSPEPRTICDDCDTIDLASTVSTSILCPVISACGGSDDLSWVPCPVTFTSSVAVLRDIFAIINIVNIVN